MLRSIGVDPSTDDLTSPRHPNESGAHPVGGACDRTSGVELLFDVDLDRALTRPLAAPRDVDPDEEITLDAPSPKVPAGTPSPLGGDDDEAPSGEPAEPPEEDEECDVHLFVRGPGDAPAATARHDAARLADIPSLSLPERSPPPLAPLAPHRPSEIPLMLSVRPRVSREAAEAARVAREAARQAALHERRTTRLVVLCIWGAAVLLGAGLAVLALAS